MGTTHYKETRSTPILQKSISITNLFVSTLVNIIWPQKCYNSQHENEVSQEYMWLFKKKKKQRVYVMAPPMERGTSSWLLRSWYNNNTAFSWYIFFFFWVAKNGQTQPFSIRMRYPEDSAG